MNRYDVEAQNLTFVAGYEWMSIEFEMRCNLLGLLESVLFTLSHTSLVKAKVTVIMYFYGKQGYQKE